MWAGPLTGGEVVVVLLNTGPKTATIRASWSDIGIGDGVSAVATELFSGRTSVVAESLSASVGTFPLKTHERLSPPPHA